MTDTRDIKVTCPYCENLIRVQLYKSEEEMPKVVHCRVERSDGCGRWFAVVVTFIPSIKTLKIEQE